MCVYRSSVFIRKQCVGMGLRDDAGRCWMMELLDDGDDGDVEMLREKGALSTGKSPWHV